MKLITRKRMKIKGFCGELNLPFNTECTLEGNMIEYEGKPVCLISSQNSKDYFVSDDDGRGTERADLINKILRLLDVSNKSRDGHWTRIATDEIAEKYRNKEHNAVWLWSGEFYLAPIEDLKYIYKKITGKENVFKGT